MAPRDAPRHRHDRPRGEDRRTDRSWWNLLVLVPLVAGLAPLTVPLFDRSSPSLGGVPFSYRYQVVAIAVAVLFAAVSVMGLGAPDGTVTVVREHLGGSAFALSTLGIDSTTTVHAGLVAVGANLLAAVVATLALRGRVADGPDTTSPADRTAEAGDPAVEPLPEVGTSTRGPACRPGHPLATVVAGAATGAPGAAARGST